MPSENDETEYSVFGDESTDTVDGSTENSDLTADAAHAEETPNSLAAGEESGCPKCGGEATETDEIATSGTGLTKMFDVQNRTFVVVSCANCGYSELYKGQSAGNAIDFFVG